MSGVPPSASWKRLVALRSELFSFFSSCAACDYSIRPLLSSSILSRLDSTAGTASTRKMSKRQAEQEDSSPAKRTRSATEEVNQKANNNLSSEVKRALQNSTVAPSELSNPMDTVPGSGVRRRMNPDSLAGRLGSDLIKELERLLKPGMTEMPSFAQRQAIQKRFNIDRRHIYDWFHNKGLRVMSSEKREEKKALKAKQEQVSASRTQASRARLSFVCAPRLMYPDEKKNKRIETAPRPRPLSSKSGSPTPPPKLAKCSTPVRSAPTHQYETLYGVQHTGFSPYHVMDPYMDTGFSTLATDVNFGAFYYPHYSVPGPLQPDRVYTPPSTVNEVYPKANLERTSNWIAEQQKIPYEPNVYARSPVPQPEEVPARDNLDVILPLDDDKTLPQHEREAYYRCLSDVLPPARGIEECVGTYKAYMSQLHQTYFERLISGTNTVSVPSILPPAASSGSSTLVTQQNSVSSPSVNKQASPICVPAPAASHVTNAAPGTNTGGDFSKWLLHGSRSWPPSHVPSPSQTPSLCDTSSTSLSSSAFWSHPGSVGFEHTRQLSSASCLDIADILESPILRSRKPTEAYGSVHAAATTVSIEGPNAPSFFPYDAMPAPALQNHLAVTSVYDYNQMAHSAFVPFYPPHAHTLPAAPPTVPVRVAQDCHSVHRVPEPRARAKGKGVAKAQSAGTSVFQSVVSG